MYGDVCGKQMMSEVSDGWVRGLVGAWVDAGDVQEQEREDAIQTASKKCRQHKSCE